MIVGECVSLVNKVVGLPLNHFVSRIVFDTAFF